MRSDLENGDMYLSKACQKLKRQEETIVQLNTRFTNHFIKFPLSQKEIDQLQGKHEAEEEIVPIK